MALQQILDTLRQYLAYWWVALVFGGIYLISQATIGILLQHLGPEEIGKLQVTGFTARDYIETFSRWENSGAMIYYKAHFVVDGIHWLWYSVSLAAWLALAMNYAKLASRHNWLLLLPIVAGLFDCWENAIQHIFLSDPDYLTVVDPLPLFSTIASICKWTLAGAVIFLIFAFFLRAVLRKK